MRADAKFWMCTLGAWLFCSAAVAAPAASSAPSIDTEFRATYPLTAPSAALPMAGVQLAKIILPGLQVTARSEHAADDGGIVLSLSDRDGVVRVLVHLAVSADATTARQVMAAELHGVSTQLAKSGDATLGDLAWADDAGKGTALVIATQANVAYSVAVVGAAPPGLPTAAATAALIRRAMVAGPPTFPAATVTLAAALDAKTGGAVRINVPAGVAYQVHAEGGYVARRQTETIVRPFGPGMVTVHATVVDELGRVTVASGSALAK